MRARAAAPRPSVETVLIVVARSYGVRAEQLRSRVRVKSLMRPKEIVAYLAREHTGCPLEAIGKAFGRRHHTTILQACHRIEARIAAGDSEVVDAIAEIGAELLALPASPLPAALRPARALAEGELAQLPAALRAAAQGMTELAAQLGVLALALDHALVALRCGKVET